MASELHIEKEASGLSGEIFERKQKEQGRSANLLQSRVAYRSPTSEYYHLNRPR